MRTAPSAAAAAAALLAAGASASIVLPSSHRAPASMLPSSPSTTWKGWGQGAVDGHVHLTNLSLLQYPWANASAGTCPCAPPCLCEWTVAQFTDASSHYPPTKFVFVEVAANSSQWFVEAQWVTQVVANSTPLLGGVVSAMPPGFGVPGVPPTEISRLLSKLTALGPLVKGFRASAVNYSDPVQMQTVLSHAQLLPAHNLSMDINTPLTGPGVVDGLVNLTRSVPDAIFVLDHIGNPPVLGTPEEQATWSSAITALAVGAGPNLFVKVGGFMQGFKSGGVLPTLEQVRPWVQKAVDAFGWSRVFWEGNWFFVDWLNPQDLDTLALWGSYADQITSDMGAGPGTPERDLFVRGTASKAYRVEGA
jgi:L-fuconolactonase